VLRRRIENPLATALLEEHFGGAWGVRVEPDPAAAASGEAPRRGEPVPLRFRPLRQDSGE
jgi:hypothetical protein